MAVTLVQLAKRAFVRVLLAFAAQYVVPVTVNRESNDKDVMAAFRAVAKRAHPDKGGNTQDTPARPPQTPVKHPLLPAWHVCCLPPGTFPSRVHSCIFAGTLPCYKSFSVFVGAPFPGIKKRTHVRICFVMPVGGSSEARSWATLRASTDFRGLMVHEGPCNPYPP